MVESFGRSPAAGPPAGCTSTWRSSPRRRGSRCIDRIAPWLPVLLAVSANSPFAEGRDTGYASWRTQLWSTWPSAGPTEAFGSRGGLPAGCERMIASGAARDPGMLYFDARLVRGPADRSRCASSTRCTDPEDAGCWRPWSAALVETAAWRLAVTSRPPGGPRSCGRRGGGPPGYGPSTRLVRPGQRTSCGRLARCSDALVDLVAGRLEAAGDAERGRRGCRAGAGRDGRDAAAGGLRAHRLAGGRGRRRARPHRGRRGPPRAARDGPRVRTWAKRWRHRSSPGPTGPATARRCAAASTCSPGCCARRGSTPTTR